MGRVIDRLEAELAEAIAELRAHMASWAYAYAMAGGANGGREHPVALGDAPPHRGCSRPAAATSARGSTSTSCSRFVDS